MFGWLKRSKVDSPKSDETVELETVKLTYVRWRRTYGYKGMYEEDCMEAFPNPDDAEKFADSLRAAYKLIRSYGADHVRTTNS